MKVAISGSHCTGKTTLVRHLSKKLTFTTVPELAQEICDLAGVHPLQDLDRYAYYIFECALGYSTYYLHKTTPNFIADRSIYDVIAYIKVMKPGTTREREYVCSKLLELAKEINYDLIIFLRFPSCYSFKLSDESYNLARQVDITLADLFKNCPYRVEEVYEYLYERDFDKVYKMIAQLSVTGSVFDPHIDIDEELEKSLK